MRQAMKTMRAKDSDVEVISYPGIAELYIEEETPIKKATYLLSDGGIVDIGIFNAFVGGYRIGVYLHRDAAGKLLEGTLCKFDEPSGEEWFQAFQQGLLGKSLN
jgi:hypothetical protein